MTPEAVKLHDEVIEVLDDKCNNLSSSDYRELLQELQATLQCRLDALDEDGE